MDRTACTEPQCLYKGALYLFFFFYCGTTVMTLRQLLYFVSGCEINDTNIFIHLPHIYFCGFCFHLDELGRAFRPSSKLRIYFYSTCHESYASDRQSSPE